MYSITIFTFYFWSNVDHFILEQLVLVGLAALQFFFMQPALRDARSAQLVNAIVLIPFVGYATIAKHHLWLYTVYCWIVFCWLVWNLRISSFRAYILRAPGSSQVECR